MNYTKYLACILIFLVVSTLTLAGYKIFQVYTHPIKYREEIELIGYKTNTPPELIASIINVESSYRANARSNKDACGLMQIKVTTANYVADLNHLDYVTEDELFNIETNMKYGTLYLQYLINKFDVLDTALAAYNAGETIVRNWLNDGIHSTDGKTLNYIPFKETRDYVEKIKDNIKFYMKIYN